MGKARAMYDTKFSYLHTSSKQGQDRRSQDLRGGFPQLGSPNIESQILHPPSTSAISQPPNGAPSVTQLSHFGELPSDHQLLVDIGLIQKLPPLLGLEAQNVG